MFHAGDQIENPVTGERLGFHETSAETDGARVVFETIVKAGGFVAAAHVHPFQTELWCLTPPKAVSDTAFDPSPTSGARHRAPRGVRHQKRRFAVRAGTLGLRRAQEKVELRAGESAAVEPTTPQTLQRLALTLGAPIGKLVGFGPTYDQRQGEPGPAIA